MRQRWLCLIPYCELVTYASKSFIGRVLLQDNHAIAYESRHTDDAMSYDMELMRKKFWLPSIVCASRGVIWKEESSSSKSMTMSCYLELCPSHKCIAIALTKYHRYGNYSHVRHYLDHIHILIHAMLLPRMNYSDGSRHHPH